LNSNTGPIAELRVHLDGQYLKPITCCYRRGEHGLVSTTLVGTYIVPDNLGKAWKALLWKAGLRDRRFHDLRHAAASLLFAEVMPVHVVSQMLGHSLTSTTMDIYGHVMPSTQHATAEAMERLFGAG